MKRVLIITYYWPPTGGSGVQRWVKFAKFLPSFGWQPVIYTPENPERLAVDESLLADIPPCTEVLKTHISEPYDSYRKVLKFFGSGRGCAPTGNGNQGEVNPINARKKGFIKKLSVLIRGNCFIPDPRVGWVKPSVSYLKKYLEEHPVDAVVTTGPPQSMHLIGLGLMKALRRKAGGTEDKVPEWIVDFRDPWTEMFYFKHLGLLPLARRKHKRLEKEVLDNADKVIAVTPLVQADFQAMTSTPVELVTNGFDEDDFRCGEEAPHGGSFFVTHTGLFAEDGNPTVLWEVLADMCRKDEGFRKALRIRLAGKVDKGITDSIIAAGLEENLDVLGYLPHVGTVREQQSASVLILPLRKEPEYRKILPGKIFEYLAARRPVLGIGQEDGAAAGVLAETGAGVMYEWDRREAMESFIMAEWDSFRNGDTSRMTSDIEKYSRKVLTEKLVALL